MVDQPTVLFPTHSTRRALAEPKRGGSLQSLRDAFELSVEHQALIVAFCLACLRGTGPYPLLLIVGPKECRNSELASFLCDLLDPSSIRLRNLPKNETELAACASSSHILAYDDVRAMPRWLEMAFSRLSKGTSFSTCRRDREHIQFQGAKPIILAGNDELLLHPELAARALIVHFPPVTNSSHRRAKHVPCTAEILGGLLGILCHGLNRYRDLQPIEALRDGRFEEWIAACELSRWGVNAFDAAYAANVSEAEADAVELDPFLQAVRALIKQKTAFKGTFATLLKELSALGYPRGTRWPENPRSASGRLRRDAKLLPEIRFDFGMREGRMRQRMMVAELKNIAESATTIGVTAEGEHKKNGKRTRKDRPGSPTQSQPSMI
jgi:hypothetical protein